MRPKVEIANGSGDYRVLAPDGTTGEVFSYGEQAHVIDGEGRCFAAYISAGGSFDGVVYEICEPGSLDILNEYDKPEVEENCEFEFDDEEGKVKAVN